MNGAVVWLTGLPSSGKTTLGLELFARLRAAGEAAVLLDGDEVREALVPKPGYTPEERAAFYDTLARLSALLSRQGNAVIVAATAHLRSYRERARAFAPRFIEVHLAVPIYECRARDAKGLYALASRNLVGALPGAGETYQEPVRPDVIARGGKDEAAVLEILGCLGVGLRTEAAAPRDASP